MAVNDEPSLSNAPDDPSAWPVVSPSDIGIPDFHYDLAYMGVHVRLQICNRSSYLVREAELRVDGLAPGTGRAVTSRYIRVGPLFPGACVEEEVGVGTQGGISGLDFETLATRAVRLTPPSEMVPALQYTGLLAEIVDVTVDEEAPDPRDRWDEQARAVATSIRIRVCNTGPAVVERARLRLRYFEVGGSPAGGPLSESPDPVAEWILDMPRSDWDPYRLPHAPRAFCDPADPLPPGQAHEFTLTHFDGGPRDWLGSRDALAADVCEVKLGACYHATP
jgi:hypothetical protein